MKKSLKRHCAPEAVATDGLGSYKASMKVLGNSLGTNTSVAASSLVHRRQVSSRCATPCHSGVSHNP